RTPERRHLRQLGKQCHVQERQLLLRIRYDHGPGSRTDERRPPAARFGRLRCSPSPAIIPPVLRELSYCAHFATGVLRSRYRVWRGSLRARTMSGHRASSLLGVKWARVVKELARRFFWIVYISIVTV